MPRRTILTERQRQTLYALPTDEPTLLRHHVLSDDDLEHIKQRRRSWNRLGFALQLCAFRYPGRLIQPGELIPHVMLSFIGAQLGISADDLAEYGARAETRYQHSSVLQQIYGYRLFEGKNRKAILAWPNEAAERVRTNEQLAVEFLEEFRRRKIIVPGISTVERCCADALVVAERTITSRIAGRLNLNMRSQLLALLEETIDGRITRFVWLRQFEPGSNSKDMNELLDRLGALREVGISADVFENVPPHRVASLRRQGERYSADGMRDLPANRRLAVLAACAFEWCAMVSDASVETHDRIVGKLYRSCERKRDEQLNDERTSIGDTPRAFSRFGEALVLAQEEKDNLDTAIVTTGGWAMFRR